ncbi:MAG: hypothetical protein ACRCU5_15020 [Rhizobiaceae bacterium]
MDWKLAITRNREALQRLVAALFALVGMVEGRAVNLLPRPVYRAVLAVLRPAESAVRRLIIIAAFGLVIAPRLAQPFPGNIASAKGGERLPTFRLIDSLKRFSPSVALVEVSDLDDIWDVEDEDADEAEADEVGLEFDALPRISVPGYSDLAFAVPVVQSLEDLIDAQPLVRRLAALKRALDNLPREARRLARWQAKRRSALIQRKPMRLSPFRPGPPPGFRAKQTHEIDDILKECHMLMLDRLAEVNTS